MRYAKIKNQASYDRTFFGISETIEPIEDVELDRDVFEVLNKNCPNFQDMTNPPAHGGNPVIKVLGSTSDGDVRINATELNRPTMFTAPKVRLRGDDITEVPESHYHKLENNSKFQSLIKDGELRMMGWEEK